MILSDFTDAKMRINTERNKSFLNLFLTACIFKFRLLQAEKTIRMKQATARL